VRALAAALRGLSVRRVHAEFDLWPNGCTVAGTLGKGPGDDPDFDFPYRCRPVGLARSRRIVRGYSALLVRKIDTTNELLLPGPASVVAATKSVE
jgi:hypothetical protein